MKGRPTAVSPILEGYHKVTPYLIVSEAAAVISFFERAFNAEVKSRLDGSDGTVMNAELKVGSSMVMVSDAREGIPPQLTSLYFYVDDVDATYDETIAAGGISVMESSGNMLWIATRKENLPDEEIRKRLEAYSTGGA